MEQPRFDRLIVRIDYGRGNTDYFYFLGSDKQKRYFIIFWQLLKLFHSHHLSDMLFTSQLIMTNSISFINYRI